MATDEAIITRNGITNLHSRYCWAFGNSHARSFFFERVAGVVDDDQIVNRMNGYENMEYLRHDMPILLEDLPVMARLRIWFLHNGPPPHFPHLTIQGTLDRTG